MKNSVLLDVSKAKLFQSAIDLFSGDALAWYRSVKNRVTDWEDLVQTLKLDFLPPDFDDIIWEEIRNRKQKKTEKVSIFLAIIALFAISNYYYFK